MKLNSSLFRGEVTHERLGPTPHTFTYPATFFGFDLSEISQISNTVSLFGHNQFRPLAIHDSDYLHGNNTNIQEQLDKILPLRSTWTHTLLISSPKYFGYAFNPVNFHLQMEGLELLAVVAEVNNTFGDRHVYPLPKLFKSARHSWTARCPKDFHVSPFNNMDGEYRFTFRIETDEVFLGVDLYRDGVCVLKTWIQGKAKPLNNASIWRYALLHPFDTALNSMPRIIWQAAQLYYKKKLAVYQRPSPESSNTLIDRDQTPRKQLVI
ncbi:MAG TPA: hypothetical protein DCX06_07860 [Opitutae bacterium]|nr:hypothetical protein [Opitutae bacterium]